MTDNPGSIIVEKQTTPNGSPVSFEFSSNYGPNFFLTDDQTNNSGPLAPGVYSVSEINIPAGWSLTSAVCNDGSNPGSITLSPGETVTCTFNNEQGVIIPGTIIIEKQTTPNSSMQSFEFSTSYSPNFFLADGQTNNSGPLTPGIYSVSEINIPSGWDLTSATCDDGSNPSAIALSPGETVTCVFINEEQGVIIPGTIIVEKQTTSDGAAQSFEFSTSYSPNFFLADNQTNNSGPLAPGIYSVSEINIPSGWDLISTACDDGSDPSAIALSPGETVTCVFTNEPQSMRPNYSRQD